MAFCLKCDTALFEHDAWCQSCVEDVGAQVRERDSRVAQLTQERDAARQVIRDGLAAWGMQRGEIMRAWVRQAAAFLRPVQEGQSDGRV